MRVRPFLLLLLLAGLVGCAPGAQYLSEAYEQRDVLSAGIVRTESGGLTEETIQRLLTSRVVLPPKAKIAVVALSESLSHGTSRFLSIFEEALGDDNRVGEVTAVPGLLLPATASLPQLREAAAIMQADLLVVYRSKQEAFVDTHVFSANLFRARGVVEAVLMDVATGTIPYADTFEATHSEKQNDADSGWSETRGRAFEEVNAKALFKTAEGLESFLQAGAG